VRSVGVRDPLAHPFGQKCPRFRSMLLASSSTSPAPRTARSGDVLLPDRSGSLREIPPTHALRNDSHPSAHRYVVPAVMPRIRRSHQRTSDCSRQFWCQKTDFLPPPLPWRASGALFLQAEHSTMLHPARPWVQAIPGTFPASKSAKRNPTQVAIKPAAASSAIPRSNPLSRQKASPSTHRRFQPAVPQKVASNNIRTQHKDRSNEVRWHESQGIAAPLHFNQPSLRIFSSRSKRSRSQSSALTSYSFNRVFRSSSHFAVASAGSRLAFPPDSCRNRLAVS